MESYFKETNINITWLYTEVGHGKGPADGVGATVKTTIKDILSYSPNSVINCANNIIKSWPISSTISIFEYTKIDVAKMTKMVPKDLKFMSKPFGLGKCHVVHISGVGEITIRKTASKLPIKATLKYTRNVQQYEIMSTSSSSEDENEERFNFKKKISFMKFKSINNPQQKLKKSNEPKSFLNPTNFCFKLFINVS